MKPIPDLDIEFVIGKDLSCINAKPFHPYNKTVLAFLNDLSKSLLSSQSCRSFPDVVAFAYWCRAANVARMERDFGVRFKRLGRGLVFHIAPANVPINFAFSLVFGLLAGNANIVRLPATNFIQIKLICDKMVSLLSKAEYALISSMTRVVRYPRSEEITAALSAICQARVIWGGDHTIGRIRGLPIHPRCVDISFSDRYSICMMDSKAVFECCEQRLSELAQGFYNDAYLMDQNACSSPHLVIWVGESNKTEAAMEMFWNAVFEVAQKKYNLQPVQAVDKLVNLCQTAINLPNVISFTSKENMVYRVRLDHLPDNIEEFRGRFGFFYEYIGTDYSCLKRIVGERYQTLAIFGIDSEIVVDFILENGLIGLDRVVPVGQALDIGVIWDGYDVIGNLSRIIHS